MGVMVSPLRGAEGNVEFLTWFRPAPGVGPEPGPVATRVDVPVDVAVEAAVRAAVAASRPVEPDPDGGPGNHDAREVAGWR